MDNKVLIKSGKWKIESESIKPYDGTFIGSEETSTGELSNNKRTFKNCVGLGCVIISIVAIDIFIKLQSPIYLW